MTCHTVGHQSNVQHLFHAPLCHQLPILRKVCHVAFHIFTFCIPLIAYRGYYGIRRIVSCFSKPAKEKVENTIGPQNLNEFFEKERKDLRNRLNNDPLFAPFRFLSDSLLTFLCGEKIHLALTPETRKVRNQNGKVVSGYIHHYNCQEDSYHPNQLKPFDLKGFWVPIKEGQLFSIQQSPAACPLLRTTDDETEILFLVHPKSESLFTPLMEKYADKQVLIPALSLSSFRTLLIAIPDEASLPQYAMVKVSLNEVIGEVLRIVPLKECAGSVATTAVFQNKVSSDHDLSFMREDFSFVPDTSLLNPKMEKASKVAAGMIHRPIPNCLSNPESSEYVIPFFTLFGYKNKVLLDLLVGQSKKTPTQFVVDSVLTPLAHIFVDLLYFKNISIEAHGQNLLLVLSNIHSNNINIKLMYRDMGGVNSLLSQEDKKALPEVLRNDDYFYFNNHFNDAANVMEGMVRVCLFNLTKQFFKSKIYDEIDPEFKLWKSAMIEKEFEGNWTLSGEDNDSHQQEFTRHSFYRYGYIEKIFGNLLLQALQNKGVFDQITTTNPLFSYEYFADKLVQPKNPYNNCVEIAWFEELISYTYPLFYECTKKNELNYL
jgi:hypothetical protein